MHIRKTYDQTLPERKGGRSRSDAATRNCHHNNLCVSELRGVSSQHTCHVTRLSLCNLHQQGRKRSSSIPRKQLKRQQQQSRGERAINSKGRKKKLELTTYYKYIHLSIPFRPNSIHICSILFLVLSYFCGGEAAGHPQYQIAPHGFGFPGDRFLSPSFFLGPDLCYLVGI